MSRNPGTQLGVGCLKGLAWFVLIYAAASAGLFALFRLRYEPEAAGPAALIAGAFVTLFSGFFTRGFSRLRSAIESQRSGGEGPLSDGIHTVTGRIVPIGSDETLLSPATGTECVAYAYEVYSRDSEGGRSSSFSGFALRPCEIRGESGAVRLLGMPFSDELKELGNIDEVTHRPHSAAFDQMKDYLSTAPIERHELSVRDFKKAFQGLVDVLKDTDGTIRKDSAAPGADPTLAGQDIAERWIPIGAEVTVTGLHSSEQGGFVNDPDWTSSRRLHLFLGNRKVTAGTLWKQAIGDFIFGFILTGVVLGIAVLVLESEGPKESLTRNVFDAVEKDDAALAKRCIQAQPLNLNLPGGGGKTPLVLAKSAAMTKLLLGAGADANRKDLDGNTPLITAVRRGDAEAVRLLLAAGASPNEPDAKKGRTPLEWARKANADELAELLVQAGAR